MVRGTVSVEGLPTITLSIASQVWKATIDTGFNGDLELPEPLRNSLNARYVGQITSALAGGKMLEEAVYLVDFPFDDKVIEAKTTFVPGSGMLIGTHLLREYRLLINFGVERLSWEELSPDGKERANPTHQQQIIVIELLRLMTRRGYPPPAAVCHCG